MLQGKYDSDNIVTMALRRVYKLTKAEIIMNNPLINRRPPTR